MQNGMGILVASGNPNEAKRLAKALGILPHPVSTATSGEHILELLRRQLFYSAIVCVELNIADTPALLYLANLPTLELLIGIGPPGDIEMEMQARFSGVDVFLARPIRTHILEEIQSLVRGAPYGCKAWTRQVNRKKEVASEKNN